jgi:hypothetical protein
MSNRKQILKGKCVGEALLWLALSPLRRQLPVIFSNGSLVYTRGRRPHHRLTASVEQHRDEHPIRTIYARHVGGSASDRTTFSIL